ncbi:MAG: alcohol dehydrogenase catalytic domain-containing protein [Halobacteriota archaeon]|nr:alcohol dehydrogenase catalytic domain-containing protein [Halobacteriota archaeon]
MKGLYFNLDLGKIKDVKNFSLVKYKDDWEVPKISEPGQVIVRTTLGGICGTDLHQVFLEISPFASLLGATINPSPLGHEIVGTVSECGADVKDLNECDRVILNPLAHCKTRKKDLCRSCRLGNWQQCYNITGGGLVTGGFSEYFCCYEGQLYNVPENVPDYVAVLTEPFAVAIHAVCRNPPKDDDTVIVVGAGTIGLMVIAAIRALGYKCRIISLARYPFQAEIASRLGSDEIFTEKKGALYKKMAKVIDEARLFSVAGQRYIFGNAGPDLIYDCVGTEASMNDALHYVKSNGKIVIVGLGYSVTKTLDWSIQAYKEVSITGSMMYGLQKDSAIEKDPFKMALDIFSDNPDLYSNIVTHRYKIEEYMDAFKCMMNKDENKGIKIVFEFC